MPIFHLAAITHTLGSLQIGSPITLATRFSVSNFWPEVLASDASMAALMGSMLVLVANAPAPDGDDAARGRLRVVSGSPVTPELALTWQHRFGVDRVGSGTYGMTEAALLTMTPPGEYRAGAAGKVTDSFEVRIVDEHDNPLPVGRDRRDRVPTDPSGGHVQRLLAPAGGDPGGHARPVVPLR